MYEGEWAGSGITVAALQKSYHGDAPYPSDDHSLGEHEPAAEHPDCRRCRAAVKYEEGEL